LSFAEFTGGDNRIAHRDLGMLDVTFRNRHSEKLFGVEGLLQEVDELCRTAHVEERSHRMVTFRNVVAAQMRGDNPAVSKRVLHDPKPLAMILRHFVYRNSACG